MGLMDNGFRGLIDNRTQVKFPPTLQTTGSYQILIHSMVSMSRVLNTNPEACCDLNNNWYPLGLYHVPSGDFLPCRMKTHYSSTRTVKLREASTTASMSVSDPVLQVIWMPNKK